MFNLLSPEVGGQGSKGRWGAWRPVRGTREGPPDWFALTCVPGWVWVFVHVDPPHAWISQFSESGFFHFGGHRLAATACTLSLSANPWLWPPESWGGESGGWVPGLAWRTGAPRGGWLPPLLFCSISYYQPWSRRPHRPTPAPSAKWQRLATPWGAGALPAWPCFSPPLHRAYLAALPGHCSALMSSRPFLRTARTCPCCRLPISLVLVPSGSFGDKQCRRPSSTITAAGSNPPRLSLCRLAVLLLAYNGACSRFSNSIKERTGLIPMPLSTCSLGSLAWFPHSQEKTKHHLQITSIMCSSTFPSNVWHWKF